MGGTISVSRESLEYETYPGGEYQVQMNGFKPKWSKDKKSINLQPQLRITNHNSLNGKSVLFNLNTGAGFIIRDFVHALGLLMDGETPEMAAAGEAGDFQLPGGFMPFDANGDPATTWGPYVGPLTGRTGRIELVEKQKLKKDLNGNLVAVPNQTQNDLKRFFCAVPGCRVAHRDNLIRG